MRVFYVALTRAKEKLIITGMEKDYEKSIARKEEILNRYKDFDDSRHINSNITQKYLSYLDWMELVYLKRKEELKDILSVMSYSKEDILKGVLVKEEEQKIDLESKINDIDDKQLSDIKELLEWEYKYVFSNNILVKSSVTKIKNMKMNLEENHEYKVPEFLKKQEVVTGAEKGSLMHLILQKLNSKEEYDKSKIQELILKLQEENIISDVQAEIIDVSKIYEFTKTNIWQEMKSAKEIQKERPFYINVAAEEIYKEENIDEKILVQGIMDLYYITDKDELVLVDYKTDRVKSEDELIIKYNEQLRLYKEALEKSLDKKVNRVYIYSMHLGKEIEI